MNIKICNKCKFVSEDFFLQDCPNCRMSLKTTTGKIELFKTAIGKRTSWGMFGIFTADSLTTYREGRRVTEIEGFQINPPFVLQEKIHEESDGVWNY